MSKQSDAKEKQGYTLAVNNCSNCTKRTFDMEFPVWIREANAAIAAGQRSGKPYSDLHRLEKNQRCGIGGFMVKKSGTCTKYEAKVAS